MAQDPFYYKCCLQDNTCSPLLHNAGRQIEWHHIWIYAGKQINEKWAIVPACPSHHDRAHQHEIKNRFEAISLQRAAQEDLNKYPKKNWKQIINYLQSLNLWHSKN